MAELYDILDANEIDGSAKDVEIVTHGAPDDTATWTDILNHTQYLPEGEYGFAMDFMIEVHQNEEYYWEVIPEGTNEGVELPVTEVKTERKSGRYYFTYAFPLSWDGGDFTFHLKFKAKDAAGVGGAFVKYADFTMTRRS